jgi:hypothetical protein
MFGGFALIKSHMKTIATRLSWRIKDATADAEKLDLALRFSREDFERLRFGFIPRDMDDRWFMFFEEPWLHIHRSWTGTWVFSLRIEERDDSYGTTEAWVCREPPYGRPEVWPTRNKAEVLKVIFHVTMRVEL